MTHLLRCLALSKWSRGFLNLLLPMLGFCAASGSEVSCNLLRSNAVEPEPFFNQPAVNGLVSFVRTSPIGTLQIVVQITGTATYGNSPTATGADYYLAFVSSDGSTLTPVPAATFAPGAGVRSSYAGNVGMLTFPANVSTLTLAVVPLDDNLIEGAESVIFSVKRDDSLTFDDDGNGNFTDDYVVADSTAREVTITDSDAQLSISATRPRAAEYTQSSGPIAGQPFITALGEFSLTFDFNPVAVKAPTAPPAYEIKMLRYGSAQNSYEPPPPLKDFSDYDLSLQANPVGTAFPQVDTLVAGVLVGGNEVELLSSLPPNTPEPAVVGGDVDAPWVNPPFGYGDIVAFQGHPHPYRVIGRSNARYRTNVLTGRALLLRPGFITLDRPVSTDNLSGAAYRIGSSIPFSDPSPLRDRRIRIEVPAPTGSGPALPSYVRSIAVAAYNDLLPEGATPVGVSLLNSSDFILRTPQQDIVTIADDESILNVVSVNDAVRGGANGLFRFTLTRALPIQSVVNYSISGTVNPLTDISDVTGVPLSNQVIIPAGVTSVDLRIRALDSATGTRTMTITLSQSLDYVLRGDGDGGANPTASIAIFDQATINSLPSAVVSVVNNAQEGGRTGAFRISLTSPAPSNTRVNFSLAGTAILGTDYRNPGLFVTIPAGSTSAEVQIVPLPDVLNEGAETVILVIGSGDGYQRRDGTISQLSIFDPGQDSESKSGPVEQNESSGCGIGSGVGMLLLALVGLWARFAARSRSAD